MTRWPSCRDPCDGDRAYRGPAASHAHGGPGAEGPRLADLAWIAGRWIDDSGGNLSEEIWAAPAGDSMMGMWRYVAGGKVRIFEMLTIGEHEGGLALRLRHFDPRLAGREDTLAVTLDKSAGKEEFRFRRAPAP